MTTIYSKDGADAAISAAIDAQGLGTAAQSDATDFAPAASGAYPVQQVALTGNLAYTLPVGAPTDQVISVVFTQDATGSRTVTYGGNPVTVDLTPGAATAVDFIPTGGSFTPRYPAAAVTGAKSVFARAAKLAAHVEGSASETHPGVTVAAIVPVGTASSIPTPTRVSAFNVVPEPAMRVTNGRAVAGGASWPQNLMIRRDPAVVTYAPGIATGTGLRVEVLTYQSKIDLILYHNGQGTQIVRVDGITVATIEPSTFTAAGLAVGDIARLGLTFTDGAPHVVEWQCPSDQRFGGYDIPAGTALAYPSATRKGARVLVVGDSFVEGTGATTAFGTLTDYAQTALGWRDVWRAGSGSTGYLADGTRTSLVDRYTNDILGQDPNMVVIALGLNDRTTYGTNPASVLTAATTVWDAIIADTTIASLVIVGPWPNGGGVNVGGDLRAMDSDLAALAAARGIRYLSPIRDGLTFGLSDGTHPNAAGHKAIGYWLAAHLAD